MKNFKKTIISLLSATTLLSNTLICTTTNAASKVLPVTRNYLVNKAATQKLNYTDQGYAWCAHFISELYGFKRGENPRYCSSVTQIVLDCIYQSQRENAFGTFHRVADNDLPIVRKNVIKDENGEIIQETVLDSVYKKNEDGSDNEFYPKQENYTPKVGDLVVYDETFWNYDEQKESCLNKYKEKNWNIPETTELEHIGLVVYVNGDTIEGNYTTNFNMNDYGNDYGAAVEGYSNISGNPANKAKHAEYVTNVNKGFIYGYISPNYAPTNIRGDVDTSGSVDLADLALLKQYVVHDPVTINRINSDTNEDGVIDLTDMTYLSMYLLDGKWMR